MASEHDQLSGLYYYGFRYYDPLALQWTQADPLYRFAPDLAWDEPRRMGLYGFNMGNPVRYLDADGREGCPPEGTTSGSAGGSVCGMDPSERQQGESAARTGQLSSEDAAAIAWALYEARRALSYTPLGIALRVLTVKNDQGPNSPVNQPADGNEEEEEEEEPDPEMQMPGRRGGGGGPSRRQGERRRAAKPDGTPNPTKKVKPHPTDPTKVIVVDPQTGKRVVKPRANVPGAPPPKPTTPPNKPQDPKPAPPPEKPEAPKPDKPKPE